MEKEKDKLWLLKSIFSSKTNNGAGDGDAKPSPTDNLSISFLSPHANSVVSRCSKILRVSTKDLQDQFDKELPDNDKKQLSYARNFLEFCSYKALRLATSRPNYLNDKEFRRLTFDMMIAWEAPGFESDLIDKETNSGSNEDVEGEDGWSLFYSNSTKMAVQVDDNKTVGPEAFARIAPACPIIADITTVHNLFDVLTSSSGSRIHFLIYNKYLQSLEKVAKFVQNAVGPQVVSNLSLADDEFIVDLDGTVPTQPVLQHIGMAAWPGRLTLTNYALYFEPGVGLYDKAVRYDLATEIKQVIKPELTGPLGARIFDKAVMYKSASIAEPVYLEFPEFKGCSRRDYWLDICLEILRAHKFIRKYNMKGNQQTEALARAILGIFRFRAVREAFRISSSNYKTLLCFNLAESLPGGDIIMETLSSRLTLIHPTTGQHDVQSPSNTNRQRIFPAALMTLIMLKIVPSKDVGPDVETSYQGGDDFVGESNPLEAVVKQLKQDTGMAEAAQATVDQVKVEGIDTNLAVMKELLFPVIGTCNLLQRLALWDDPLKSVIFLLFSIYMILRWHMKVFIRSYFMKRPRYLDALFSPTPPRSRSIAEQYLETVHLSLGTQTGAFLPSGKFIRDWARYLLPSIFVYLALVMLWRRYAWRRRKLEAFKIIAPPSKNAVEQLLTLQEAITQVESLIQSGNIILLKLRALLFAVVPQATDKLAFFLVLMATLLAFVPIKYLILAMFLECFTMNMPLRKESTERGTRRVREWWIRIPAAPVQLMKPDDKKRK